MKETGDYILTKEYESCRDIYFYICYFDQDFFDKYEQYVQVVNDQLFLQTCDEDINDGIMLYTTENRIPLDVNIDRTSICGLIRWVING